MPFAAPLKAMAAALLEADVNGPAEIEQILSVGKQKELGLLAGAPTARHLLQTLGTAWGRERIHPRLWIELWEDRVQSLLAQGRPVVCDDLRTPEEMAAINGEHRGRPEPTDVLSFPVDGPDALTWPDGGPPPELGDILICPEAAEEPLTTLAVHGLLHLVGYDHEVDDGEMLALQDEIVDAAGAR